MLTLKKSMKFYNYYLIVGAEMLRFVEMKDNKVKLTDRGHRDVLETWTSIIKDWLGFESL